jgi:hypothetical protein
MKKTPESPKVDRAEFEKILGRLIATPPGKRSEFRSPRPKKKTAQQ